MLFRELLLFNQVTCITSSDPSQYFFDKSAWYSDIIYMFHVLYIAVHISRINYYALLLHHINKIMQNNVTCCKHHKHILINPSTILHINLHDYKLHIIIKISARSVRLMYCILVKMLKNMIIIILKQML